MHRTQIFSCAVIVVVGLLGGARGVVAAPSGPMAEAEEFFEKQVRPMLVQNCVSCHGPKLQESGLRLDSRDQMMKGVEGHPIIVPGHPETSRLISVTRYDGDVQMPPEGKLPEKDLAVLVKWVKMGAPWPAHDPASGTAAPATTVPDMEARFQKARANHWAFQPLRRPPLPKLQNQSWCKTPVDNFILAKLEQAGIKPSPAVNRRTLLRRVTFDLTGLPPTAEEVAAFEQDKSPNAYAKVVDRLLASPKYGERWARHWLDVARYADTKGYVFTEDGRYPYAYTYRDYVVRAFNEDLPYNRFVLEQLAADQLPLGDDNRALAAMGFLSVGRRFGNNQQDIIDDRIDVVSRGLLGMTVACARCHDHKYDPLPTEDYYSLYGVLGSYVEPEDLPLIGKPDDTPAYREYLAQLAKLEDEVNTFKTEKAAEYQEQVRNHVGDYLAQILIERYKKTPDREDFEFIFAKGQPRPSVVRRWNDYLNRHARERGGVFGLWHRFGGVTEDEFDAGAAKIIAALQSEPNGSAAKSKDPATNALVRQAFLKAPPKSMEDVVRTYDRLLADVLKQWQEQSAAAAKAGKPIERLADPAAEELRLVLFGPDSPASIDPELVKGLLDQGESTKLNRLKAKVNELKVRSPASPPRAMVVLDPPQPMNPQVFIRGNPGRRGKAVPRQFLRIVAGDQRQPFQKGSGRLELAEAIVRPDNPLTARVLVNRIWMHHFGSGLARQASDFGLRSDPPSHPELLDYLASTFIEEGWSIKKLHREIVLSNTYQQSSNDRPELEQIDPENRLLARMNRQRLEFEAVRDSILAVAGTLDPTIGGKPVNLTKQPYSLRRTIYGLVDRQDLPDMFQVFDFASPDVSTEQRARTTVPQQALFAMNSPFVLEQAQKLAGRALEGTTEQRVRALYRMALERDPSPEEVEFGVKFVAAQQAAWPKPAPPVQAAATTPAKPAKPTKGKQPEPPAPPPPPLTPWAMYAQVLLLTNEFMFID
jgi:cytochrome c553